MIYNCDELSFQILTIDRFFHKKGVFNVKARPYAALSFRISGTGAFMIDDKSFNVKPGDFLYIPANTPYKVEYSVSESIVVHLSRCNYSEAEAFSPENAAKISVLIFNLLENWKARHSINQAKSTLYGIFEKIDEDQKISNDNTPFLTCLRYIEEHFCDPSLEIGTICKIGFISPSGLQRSFLQHFGVSPKQYVIKLRMNKAIQLLAENKLSIKEISYSCGFFDEKYFSRLFKGRYGYPPSKLQKHIIE